VGQKCSNSMPNWLKCSPPNKGGGGDFLQPPSVRSSILGLKIREAEEALIGGEQRKRDLTAAELDGSCRVTGCCGGRPVWSCMEQDHSWTAFGGLGSSDGTPNRDP
jgi:hypothetical protein